MSESSGADKQMHERVATISSGNPADLLSWLETVKNRKELRAVVIDLTRESDVFARNAELEESLAVFPFPLILAVDGTVSGWVAGVLLASHICYAAASTVIEFDEETNLSVYVPDLKLNEFPPRILSAGEGADLGIVNRMTDGTGPFEAAYETACRIARYAPLAVRSCILSVENAKGPLDQRLENELRLFSSLFDSKDMKRGINSFLDKSEPHFEGN